MTTALVYPGATRLSSPAGVAVEFNANGAIRRFDCQDISLSLFIGSELEGSPANLFLRLLENPVAPSATAWTALLGPHRAAANGESAEISPGVRRISRGRWCEVDYEVSLALAQDSMAWFWHVRLTNTAATPRILDLTYAQDVALAPYGAVRMNEYYVSQYIDHTPLSHPERGTLIASRQNQAVGGRYPWCLIGSLNRCESFATDALQLFALSRRAGTSPPGLARALPNRRLQHEHSMVVLRDRCVQLKPGQHFAGGFFGRYLADHPAATSAQDLQRVAEVLTLREAALPEAAVSSTATDARTASSLSEHANLFTSAPLLASAELDEATLRELFPGAWRQEERDEQGARLSFFHGADRHVVLRGKELQVLRPHGQLLRSGLHVTPDETALTSTVWMAGVFHSMVTQGHVNINRLLSTVHGYLGWSRAAGQRVFVEIDRSWQLLDVPAAFEMTPQRCRWIYAHAKGRIEVVAAAHSEPEVLSLTITSPPGVPLRYLIVHHVALNGDDGASTGPVQWRLEGNDLLLAPAEGSELFKRFPRGRFRLSPTVGTRMGKVAGDELLFTDGRSRGQPCVCCLMEPAIQVGLRIIGELIPSAQGAKDPQRVSRSEELEPSFTLTPPAGSTLAEAALGLADIAPWWAQNAWVHYLSPRGLEQYSGGGWGTRDVCQGPVELLLALGRHAPVREILLRLMAQQNADGDWPQWFMFFERERAIRASDAHGDIVFWPLLVVAQYLLASGDVGVLDERVPLYDARGPEAGERLSVWEHVQRALALIERRVIAGTTLAAYGHGDWNDSLQPADPQLRERLCSAWTVTLQVQTLRTLASALRAIGRPAPAVPLEQRADRVQADFDHWLLIDGVLTGYALFDGATDVRYLLHPRDAQTGLHYSALAMIHAVLEELFSPEVARAHVQLIESKLSGPDGVRLFDRPMDYHGGPQQLFQRAESATYFGREIGLMYMHAHLRYAQALAHLGESERFFRALCQANPIAIGALVASARLRQSNCYFSSSDALFHDRYEASQQYERLLQGAVPLEGGWRVYSSGAGIATALIMRRFLGVSCEAQALQLDPVMPTALDGLRAQLPVRGRRLEIHYRVGVRGCGVRRVQLNGRSIAFTQTANAYRPGAARLVWADLEGAWQAERNELQVEIG